MKKNSFIKHFMEQLKTDPIPDWAATFAYYFMLSIFPLLIFMIALLPYFQLNIEQVYQILHDYVPSDLAELFGTTILEVISQPSGGLLSFGVLAAMWSASNGINALIRAINRAYNIEETRNFLSLRLLSILLTLCMIFVVVTTLLLPVFGKLIINGLEFFLAVPPETADFLNMLRWVIGIILMTLVLMFLYWAAPNVKLKFRHVIIGALSATIGWQIISLAFSFYVTNFGNYSATYGSLGGVIILMLWFFLTGLIIIVGGEINATIFHQKKEARIQK
jgi:membrane protein